MEVVNECTICDLRGYSGVVKIEKRKYTNFFVISETFDVF